MSSTNAAERKRKRRSEGAERPSKRVSLNGDSEGPRINITHIPRDEKSGPVILSTPGLSLPDDIKFQAYHKQKSSSKSSSHELLLHSSEHPRLDYVAREENDGNTAEGLLKHYIGIYDPQTGEMQVMEARHMSVRSTLRSEEEEVRQKQQAKHDSVLSRRQELGMAFGTRKAKKAISSLAENAISASEPIAPGSKPTGTAAAVLESMAASASAAPSQADNLAEMNAAKPRPKYNSDAQKVEDIYAISSIVGDNVMREVKVKPWVDAVEAGTPVTTSSQFVSRRLESIVDEDDIKKLKVLKYLLLLIKFYLAVRPMGKGKGRKLPTKEVLREKMEADATLVDTIRKRFADGAEMTKWHVDHLITHMCAISLIVDDYETDTHDLREDLGLTSKLMLQYFSEVGSKVVAMTESERNNAGLSKAEASMHKLAKLRLPLEFPKEKRGPPQRRR